MRSVALVAYVASALGCRWGFDEQRVVDAETPCVPAVDVVQIASGRDYSCALLAGGEVRCWGAGESGQLGDGTRSSYAEPVAPMGLSPATMISTGVQHACAVVDGDVWCWGRNDMGQLGLGNRATRDMPARVGQLPDDVVGVSAGGLYTCAWTASGELYCWGQRTNANSDSTTPVRVTGVPAIVDVAASSRDRAYSATHACAIGIDGSAWCWGANGAGELGIDEPSTTSSDTPRRVDTSLAFVEIAAGRSHSCGRTDEGVVACWGFNATGEIGDGSRINRYAPVTIAVPPSVEIAANEETTCSRDRDGGVTCWGANEREQLARSGADGLVPERIDVPAVSALGVGESHTCAIRADGVVTCWGSDRAGQRSGVLDPASVVVDVEADAIAAGGDTTCALANGRVRCWGFGGSGQLGDGRSASSATPVDLGLADVTSVSVGSMHACARLADSRVACWGYNESGRVIFGGNATHATPQVVGAIGIAPTSVSAGGAHTCSLGASGVPWCWGNADEGTLGLYLEEASSGPIASMFANAASVATGHNHTCIVTTTNQVWCSGRDNEGQLGVAGNPGDAYTPLEVVDAPSAAMVSAGDLHTCAVSTAGAGWCWGDNTARQLGDGSDLRSEVPRSLPMTGLVEIAAGASHSCARDASSVWCWGSNTAGQLGDGTLASRGLPTLAPAFSGAVQLALGTSHTCARMPDRTVRCTGARTWGQAGAGVVVSPAPRTARLTCPAVSG